MLELFLNRKWSLCRAQINKKLFKNNMTFLESTIYRYNEGKKRKGKKDPKCIKTDKCLDTERLPLFIRKRY